MNIKTQIGNSKSVFPLTPSSEVTIIMSFLHFLRRYEHEYTSLYVWMCLHGYLCVTPPSFKKQIAASFYIILNTACFL